MRLQRKTIADVCKRIAAPPDDDGPCLGHVSGEAFAEMRARGYFIDHGPATKPRRNRWTLTDKGLTALGDDNAHD